MNDYFIELGYREKKARKAESRGGNGSKAKAKPKFKKAAKQVDAQTSECGKFIKVSDVVYVKTSIKVTE